MDQYLQEQYLTLEEQRLECLKQRLEFLEQRLDVLQQKLATTTDTEPKAKVKGKLEGKDKGKLGDNGVEIDPVIEADVCKYNEFWAKFRK